MPKLRTLLPALALAATLHAQLTPIQDPANLAGERVSPQDPADTLPLNHGAPALQQLLAKLRTRASLMLIVAHPDDEDGGLLTYESRGQGARVAMLTLTRGEGGQNLMSADFDDALGLIRTQELLAADRYFGVDQFFGTEIDFGFSKTKEESFGKWTHDRVLYDAVRAVRLYRPLVIASVFVGGPTDGHGQHQVAGEIAQEVFVAAADPKVFPEMIAEGLLPWAPLKVYARVPFSRVTPEGMYDYATGKTVPTRFHNYVTGEDSTAVPTATVLIHEGDKPSDPTLAAAMGGDTFLQFARKGLALQKTQIGPNARLAPAGAFDAGYTLMATRLNCPSGAIPKTGCPIFATASSSLRWASTKATTEQSLFDGIDTSLTGIASLDPDALPALRDTLRSIDLQIAEAIRLFDPAQPERIAPLLREALMALDKCMARAESNTRFFDLLHELRMKRVQLNDALVLALGVELRANSSTIDILTTHPSVEVTSFLTNKRDTPIRVVGMNLLPTFFSGIQVEGDTPGPTLGAKAINFYQDRYTFFMGVQETRPYFSRKDKRQAFYDVANPELRNATQSPAPFIVQMSLEYGAELNLMATVKNPANNQNDTANQPQATAIVPPITLELSPTLGIFATAKANMVVQALVKSRNPSYSDSGEVHLEAPKDWLVEPSSYVWTPEGKHATGPIPFEVVYKGSKAGTSACIQGIVGYYGHDYTESFRPVGYPGIPYTNFYTPAAYRAIAVDLHTAPNLRVAYLPGTGDPVPDFLPNLGITPTILTLKDLNPATLNKYDTILLGVRAYAAHPELAGPGSQPLLDYAKQGGVVVLQYNTARFGDAEAPFPIAVPGDPAHNVVEEAQPVTLLHPDAPLLTWPNKITPADFDNWVAERGHGFAASWSPQYQPLLETHDVGQDLQQGGLLLARTGKGAYIYCALALYRQLPEGVPGAYRLLANLLSYAKNPQRP